MSATAKDAYPVTITTPSGPMRRKPKDSDHPDAVELRALASATGKALRQEFEWVPALYYAERQAAERELQGSVMHIPFPSIVVPELDGVGHEEDDAALPKSPMGANTRWMTLPVAREHFHAEMRRSVMAVRAAFGKDD